MLCGAHKKYVSVAFETCERGVGKEIAACSLLYCRMIQVMENSHCCNNNGTTRLIWKDDFVVRVSSCVHHQWIEWCSVDGRIIISLINNNNSPCYVDYSWAHLIRLFFLQTFSGIKLLSIYNWCFHCFNPCKLHIMKIEKRNLLLSFTCKSSFFLAYISMHGSFE